MGMCTCVSEGRKAVIRLLSGRSCVTLRHCGLRAYAIDAPGLLSRAGACSGPGGASGYGDQGSARYTIVFLCLFVFEKKVLWTIRNT